jgi:hypothetical protein
VNQGFFFKPFYSGVREICLVDLEKELGLEGKQKDGLEAWTGMDIDSSSAEEKEALWARTGAGDKGIIKSQWQPPQQIQIRSLTYLL